MEMNKKKINRQKEEDPRRQGTREELKEQAQREQENGGRVEVQETGKKKQHQR